MDALADLNSAVADVTAYVGTLKDADLTPGIVSATAALRALLPTSVAAEPVPEPQPINE